MTIDWFESKKMLLLFERSLES